MKRRALFPSVGRDEAPRVPHVGSPGAVGFTNALLRTHEDKQVRFYDDLIKGKQVIINLMYASCEGVCPVTTSNMIKVHQALKDRMGRDLFMYSISIKPEDDDPAALRRFAEMHGALLPGWTFLTGDPYDIETIRFKLFRWDHIKFDTDLDSHTSMLRIINDASNRWNEVTPMASLYTVLQHISWTNSPKPFNKVVEENEALQKRIDKEVKTYGYRRTT
ncbi:MAG TPA: SCO family protein [Blastocatellia bacterium]|jgi:protein SCO1/2|nr:SCO family protein [Blastocatellia bacterium]